MTENLKKFEEAMKESKALAEKFRVEFKRLITEKIASSDGEAVIKAAKDLGFEVTLADLEKAQAEAQNLDQEELNAVAGGGDDELFAPAKERFETVCALDYSCHDIFLHNHKHKQGEKEPCWHDYLCMTGANESFYHDYTHD
ncbi:MAG: Nif11-like leader peptide family RiPP precursor [Clostridia bacterium]|nr:Nif11-like leader peptide family RiPP precursor [Clostridia bacterium]